MDRATLENLCDRWLAAWTGNADKLLEFYAPDAYYEDPARPDGLHGHSELRPYLQKLLARNPNWTWTRKSLHPIDGGFVVRHEARVPTAAGTILERCMDLVLLDQHGLITRNEVYFDRSRWMAAIEKTRA